MTQGHLPPASEPDPSVQTSREEAAILRVKETAARFIGALALGTAAVIISAELSRIGSQPPDTDSLARTPPLFSDNYYCCRSQ